RLTAILEDTLKIRIDRIVDERLRVALDTNVNPLAENIRFASEINIQPDCVTVTGPTSIIEQFGGHFFVDIGERELRDNFSGTVPLVLPEEHEEILTFVEKEVDVSFEVVEFLTGQRVVNIRKLNFPSTVSLASRDSIVVMQYLLDDRQTQAFSDLELEA